MTEKNRRVDGLRGGRRTWWCVRRGKFVEACHVYIAFGCPDWGELGGRRNNLCTFCALPEAARMYRGHFFDGHMTSGDHLGMFKRALVAEDKEGAFNTLAIFNAGSFFAMPESLQNRMLHVVTRYPYIKSIVLESRAGRTGEKRQELITSSRIREVRSILGKNEIALTIRIGVESQDDHLRQSILKKGHTREKLRRAVSILRDQDVFVGGYVMLNPAPDLDPSWALNEGKNTLEWVLSSEGLGMNEAYYCATCVGRGTPYEEAWREGSFSPASLWMVFDALKHGARMFPGRVHMLPFKDEPPFLSVPSNHVGGGVPQDLSASTGCDMKFHEILERYRGTMDPGVLQPPECSCRPEWLTD